MDGMLHYPKVTAHPADRMLIPMVAKKPDIRAQTFQSFYLSISHDGFLYLCTRAGHLRINAPMAASSKFLHLKFLSILLISGSNFDWDYDYLSLIPFFDASPSLETFRLYVAEQSMSNWFEGDPSSLRRVPQHCHGSLKSVKIIGFFPQKSILELTCHILENATSLESLTVDASDVNCRCSGRGRKCCPLKATATVKARKSVLAVKKYIEGSVPSTVKLNVPEPCRRCV